MRKFALAKSFLSILIVSLAVFVVASTSKPGKSSQANSPSAGDNDKRPLKEKAKQQGHFVGFEGPRGRGASTNLAELAQHSMAVVIGVPQSNMSTLSADGLRITINYNVRIEYSYKGPFKEGDILTVKLPGGRITFSDGSTAEVRTPWFKKMQNGSTYALFLNPDGKDGSYVTTGDAQGVFEIPTKSDNRFVKGHFGVPRDPMWKYQNMDVRAFLREIRQATKKG